MTVPSAPLGTGGLAAEDHHGPKTPRLVLDAGYLNSLLPSGNPITEDKAEEKERGITGRTLVCDLELNLRLLLDNLNMLDNKRLEAIEHVIGVELRERYERK